MARTTPAQNPRGWARITCISIPLSQLRASRSVRPQHKSAAVANKPRRSEFDDLSTNVASKRLEDLGDDSLGVEACLGVHHGWAVLVDERVRQHHAAHFETIFERAGLGKSLQDMGAEAANGALFESDQHLMLAREPQQKINIEWLCKASVGDRGRQ